MRWLKLVAGTTIAGFGALILLEPLFGGGSPIWFYGLGFVLLGWGGNMAFRGFLPEEVENRKLQERFDAIPFAEETSGISDEEAEANAKKRAKLHARRAGAGRRR